MSKLVVLYVVNNHPSVIFPSPDLDVNEVACKQVPAGEMFWVIAVSELGFDNGVKQDVIDKIMNNSPSGLGERPM